MNIASPIINLDPIALKYAIGLPFLAVYSVHDNSQLYDLNEEMYLS